VSRNLVHPVPHSWSIRAWPAGVYPNDPKRGLYLVREHKSDLLASGALSRIGRELVVIGHRYSRWLERNASRVPEYEIAPNRPRTNPA
jgi:hypothetical protein